MTQYAQYYLSCANADEASRIADILLDKRLIACAKHVPIKSKYWWQGKKESAEEILIIMESRVDYFDRIENEVKKLHSYDTFVLECLPIAQINKAAESWLESSLS